MEKDCTNCYYAQRNAGLKPCFSCIHFENWTDIPLEGIEEEPQQGLKYDQDKIRMDLLEIGLAEPLEAVAEVLTYGAKKYADNSWQGVEPKRYIAAMHRHLNKYYRGEGCDEESGLSHMAHAACNALFLLHFAIKANKGADLPTLTAIEKNF